MRARERAIALHGSDRLVDKQPRHHTEHNNPGLRSRVLTRTSHWVDFPAGKSLDGYPAGKDPVLRS